MAGMSTAKRKSQRDATAAAAVSAPGMGRAKRFAINSFVIFHIVVISLWAIPFGGALAADCKNFVIPYLRWSGLFQTWDMFSPSPKSVNSYIEAVVIYRDDSSETWTFPRMEQLSFTERYFKERYRKFEENLPVENYSLLMPDAARYVARMKSTAANPVETVMLVDWWSRIPPAANANTAAAPPEAHVFFTYRVQPEDLK
jgi:hypothetical protein